MRGYTAMQAPVRTQSERDRLVTSGLPWVRRIAFRLARRLPPNVEVDDLIGAGTEGLLRAADSYDVGRYPEFEPYAKMRIRGAMLDALRAFDPMTRHGRRKLAELSRVIRDLERSLDRSPEPEEIAKAMGISLDDYYQMAEEVARVPLMGRLGDVEVDDVEGKIDDPADLYSKREMRAALAQAITKLPKHLQQVLALYYQEELTQAEVGKVLGVSDSRVCQLLGEASARLRATLTRKARPKPTKQARKRA
ncbi:MAG: FliA/WhiG family RNA polymerase sigma factor [Polyangiales bacterium]